MTTSPDARPTALLIVPEAHGAETAGDRVVLRRVTTWLSRRFAVTSLPFARTEGARKALTVLLRQLPLELAPYWRPEHRARARAAASAGFDQIFILHEGLFYLADQIRDGTPITLFAHNMLSRFTMDSPVQPVLTALSRRYERRWYAQSHTRLVLISRGDRKEAVRLGLAAADAPIAPPGAPVSSELSANAVFTGEAVLTGTYDWWRKRRDLHSFGDAGQALAPLTFDRRAAEVVPGARLLPEKDAIDWSAAIRAGLITDRFAGGFKLKSLEYVANNCMVFSRAPMMEEFEGLPHAREFIVDDLPEHDWAARVSALKSEPQEALRERFLAFKSACLDRFNWETCLEALAPGVPVSG